MVSKSEAHVLTAKMEGRVAIETTRSTISTTGILDIVGGFFFLLPFLGLLGGGFWKLTQEHYELVFPPK